MNGVMSEVGWISTCSVHTTAQPPSALTLRIAASALGSRYPMPLQCGTWKNRFLVTRGPIATGSKRMSYGGGGLLVSGLGVAVLFASPFFAVYSKLFWDAWACPEGRWGRGADEGPGGSPAAAGARDHRADRRSWHRGSDPCRDR